MAYDTAIAQVNIDTSTIIPGEFVPNEAVNLVFDDIDFGEEIKKQTHATKGSHSVITPFSIGKKETPQFHKESGTTATDTSVKMAERLDLVYVRISKDVKA